MRLDFVTLAENVVISEGKLYIHGGALTVLQVPQLPWFAELSVAGRLEADDEELGSTHQFSLAVFQPDGELLFPLRPIDVALTESNRVAENWGGLHVLISLKLAPIGLRETGWYTVDIALDEESIAQLAFLVRIAPPIPAG